MTTSDADRGTEPGAATVFWVDNHFDVPATVRYLADVAACTTDDLHGGPDYRPVVLRPTPGGGDRGSIALDLLTALGKNPDVLRTEHLRGEAAWRTARPG